MWAGRLHKKAVGRVGVGWLVTLGVLVCTLMTSSSPALASATCAIATYAAEVGARSLPLEPTNGATVPAGTPVVFSAESLLNNAPRFSVASSPGQLSSPDIDSGFGSKSGAFYELTSTNATATPRTIYWTVSFTFTPDGCESPSTFTTPVRTLVVAPTEAELSATKRQQEEEATKKKLEEATTTKKKLEEEAAAKKKDEEEAAAAGSVVLDGLTVDVKNRGEAVVKLTCSDVAICVGKLMLTASRTGSEGKTRHARTESIGTAGFSIAAGEAATVKFTLDKIGRALLSAAHGHLNGTMTVVRIAPLPNKTQTQRVRLEQQMVAKATGRK
jgi:hypothetical protein